MSWTMPGGIERRLDAAVEVGAQRDVLDAGDVRRRSLIDRAIAVGVVAAARGRPEPDADEAASRGDPAQVLVGQVAAVVGHAADARVRRDDGPGRDGQDVVDGGGRGVGHVHDHPARLHPPDHLVARRR